MLFPVADNSSSNRLLEYYSDGCIEYEVIERKFRKSRCVSRCGVKMSTECQVTSFDNQTDPTSMFISTILHKQYFKYMNHKKLFKSNSCSNYGANVGRASAQSLLHLCARRTRIYHYVLCTTMYKELIADNIRIITMFIENIIHSKQRSQSN